MTRKEGKNIKKILVGSLIAVFVMSLIAGLILGVQPVSASSSKKAPIHINNTGGGALSYYQVNLNITYDANMNTNFSDLRVKNETAGAFVPYWIEDKVDGSWCNLWFNASYIPASSWCNDTYYLYYDDAGASSVSNITTTFHFGDDFVTRELGIMEKWSSTTPGYEGQTAIATIDGIKCFVMVRGGVYYAFNLSDGSEYKNVTVGEGNDVAVGLDIGDINDDGNIEIAFLGRLNTTCQKTGVIDKDGNELWNKTYTSINAQAGYIKIGDLDSNITGLEVAVMADGYLYVYDKDGNHLWNKSAGTESETIDGPCIGDFNGDGKNDIFVASNSQTCYAFEGEDGTELWNRNVGTAAEDAWVADLNGDGKTDVVLGGDNTPGTPRLYALNGSNGNNLWQSADQSDDVEAVCVYNASGEFEVAMTGRSGVKTTVFFKNGTMKWESNHHSTIDRHSMAAGDINSDGVPEVIVVEANGISSCLTIFDSENGDVLYEKVVGSKAVRVKVEDGGIYLLFAGTEEKANAYVLDITDVDDITAWTNGEFYVKGGEANNSITAGNGKIYGSTAGDWNGARSTMQSVINGGWAYEFEYEYNSDSSDNFIFGLFKEWTDKDGYFIYHIGGSNDYFYIGRLDNGATNYESSIPLTLAEGNTYRFLFRCDQNGVIKLFVDGVEKGSRTDTNYSQFNDADIEFFNNNNKVSFIFVRKYASPEPTASLGDEQPVGACTTPTITDLTNSTPGTTNVTITWSTNQSADNRVKYSKNSDLSNEEWSSWNNDTYSISIELSSLDSGTPYYYQAWSYNGTNSSCSITEPVSSPYKTFTTQSTGGGAYNITLLTGWNIIGWTDTTARTAHYIGTDIGANCTYISERNKTTDNYVNHNMGGPEGEDNFAIERGWGYYAYITAETVWDRTA